MFLINLFSLKFSDAGMGEWGDFFGGVLNPILTFLTFMGLLITIILQQSELRESKQEFKRSADALTEQSGYIKIQKFESTYFHMISFLNESIINLEVTETDDKLKGRKVFKFYHQEMMDRINSNLYNTYEDERKVRSGVASFIFHYNHDVEHYFIQIKNILQFIHNSNIGNNEFYANLLSSQLTQYEKGLIFHYAFTDEEYKNLVDEFNLLSGLVLKHFTYDPRVFNPYSSIS